MTQTIENWISFLVRRGFDVVETKGYTSRAKNKDDRWNTNHPITHLSFYLKALPEQKSKIPEIVIIAYGSNGHIDTIYATGFSGKIKRQYSGFIVTGTKEYAISTFEDMEILFKDLGYRNY